MANFVEQATLLVKDKATKDIRKVNKELNKLHKTADRLKSMPIKMTGITAAIRDVTRLGDQLRRLPRSKTISVRIQKAGSLAGVRNSLKGGDLQVAVRPAATKASVAAFARDLRTALKAHKFTVHVRPIVGNINSQVAGSVQTTPRTGGQRVRLDYSGLDQMLRNSWARLGMTIEQAVIRGFERGASAQDVAGTRLGLQGLNPQQAAQVGSLSAQLSGEFQSFTRGEIQGSLAELLPVVRGDAEALGLVSREILRMAELQVALGSTAEEAIDRAFLFAKAGESAGRFTDAEGNIDRAGIDQFFDLLTKGMVEFGREIDANLVRTLTKSLRTSKFGLDERGFLTSLLLAEEQGSTAGVGINQLIKQLSGERIQKKQMSRLIELGLVSSREIVTGTEGGKPVTEIIVEGTVGEDELRENPAAWVNKYVIPVMRKAGFDPANAVDAARFAGSITSDRTATDQLTAIILRNAEIEDTVTRALAKDTSDETVDAILDKSLLLALEEAGGQFTNVLGEVARSAEGVLIPAMNTVADGFSALANFISGPDGEGSLTRTLAVTAGGTAAVATGAVVGKKALNALNPLTGSAAALTGSATNLNAAAAALQRAAGAQTVGGAGRGAGGGKGRSWSASVGSLLRYVPALALAGAGAAGVSSDMELMGLSEEERKTVIDAELEATVERTAGWNRWLEDLSDKWLGESVTDSLVTRQSERDAKASMNREIFNRTQYGMGQQAAMIDFAKVNRLIAVMELNAEKMHMEGRSEAAINDFVRQQHVIADDLRDIGLGEDRVSALLNEFAATPSDLTTAFADGADIAVPQIGQAAEEFGPVAGQGLLALAPQIGQAIGQATLQVLQDLQIGVGVNEAPVNPQLDTGRALPF
jgi:hypothetical protein